MNNKIDDKIYQCIEGIKEKKKRKIIIYPFGGMGKRVKKILNTQFGIKEWVCCDNVSCDNQTVYPLTYLDAVKCHDDLLVILACNTPTIYREVFLALRKYVSEDNIVQPFAQISIGKYSYGSLCDKAYYWGIESIGAFCSFALGVEVAGNHSVYISSHEFLSFPGNWENHPGYVYGTSVLKPRPEKKTNIGNDVWIGRNATIIAGVNVGNGAIIGAGAIVTKDVPDYAVVGGAPARVLYYRYLPDQISKLNKIAWWNWSDELIIKRQADFYLDINEFIEKYYTEG